MTEHWLPVIGYEAEYEVSSIGRVRSIRRVLTNSRGITRPYGGKVIASKPGVRGHRYVTLSKANVVTTHAVHVLVCTAFRGPCPADKDLVAHWDGIPDNNRAGNVRWATFAENEADKRRHDRHAAGERNPGAKLTLDEVAEIRRRHDGLRGIGSALSREFGVAPTQISDIVNEKCWSEDGNAARRARRGLRRPDPIAAASIQHFGSVLSALRDWRLSAGEIEILAALLRVPILTERHAREIAGTANGFAARIYKMRKRLAPHGLTISSSRAGGVWIDPETAAQVRRALGQITPQQGDDHAHAA